MSRTRKKRSAPQPTPEVAPEIIAPVRTDVTWSVAIKIDYAQNSQNQKKYHLTRVRVAEFNASGINKQTLFDATVFDATFAASFVKFVGEKDSFCDTAFGRHMLHDVLREHKQTPPVKKSVYAYDYFKELQPNDKHPQGQHPLEHILKKYPLGSDLVLKFSDDKLNSDATHLLLYRNKEELYYFINDIKHIVDKKFYAPISKLFDKESLNKYAVLKNIELSAAERAISMELLAEAARKKHVLPVDVSEGAEQLAKAVIHLQDLRTKKHDETILLNKAKRSKPSPAIELKQAKKEEATVAVAPLKPSAAALAKPSDTVSMPAPSKLSSVVPLKPITSIADAKAAEALLGLTMFSAKTKPKLPKKPVVVPVASEHHGVMTRSRKRA